MKISTKMKSLLSNTWAALVWLLMGVSLLSYFGWNIKHPPVNTDEMTVSVYMPARGEVQTKENVRAVTQVRGGEVGPFRIFVSQDQFDQLVAQSTYQPIISQTTDGAISWSFTRDYWLSRGDGAWYTTSRQTQAKYWGFWWSTKWVRQTDTQWIARPVFDPNGSLFLMMIGGVIIVFAFGALISGLGELKSESWRWAHHN